VPGTVSELRSSRRLKPGMSYQTAIPSVALRSSTNV
jgi:hypothetical protein